MTLVVTLHTRHTIWMLADRRLSYPDHFTDDACKIMALEDNGAVALLGYAGLGSTTGGTQPSDWMSRVLNGRRGGVPDLLDSLGEAMKRQLPKHLAKFPTGTPAVHTVIAPTFIDGKLRTYSITVGIDRISQSPKKIFNEHLISPEIPKPTFALVIGSGSAVISRHIDQLTIIKRVAKLHDRQKVSALEVADKLAALNLFAHKNTPNNTVGPNCIVAWRYNPLGTHQGGGGHHSYTRTQRDEVVAPIPTIANGMDVRAISELHIDQELEWMRATDKDSFKFDFQKIDEGLARLPEGPDERLI